MKDFKDFLRENPMTKASLIDTLYKEFEECSIRRSENPTSRLVASSLITMVRILDHRLEAYHKWLSRDESSVSSK